MDLRIGLGFDVHALENGRKLVLGGVEIDHYKGCVAHSDGDVLIHAICDALLGAANLRDIGYHFPDNDDSFKNIDSKILLQKTKNIIQKANYSIVNIDSVILLQKPKIKDIIPQMQSTLAKVLEISEEIISIKATTTEKLGFEGREEGISAQAIVLLRKI
ncbi:MAG: 2-C-methyl-D-erythritol 2,4-cyclodiphosphate synthase [Bacteroidales bacterium]|jgi:2-C-methyl-D-erythritol 2,4-cyclodiphosphate synthase|nr:2-C-methyl-D-erythritol 2,4-cyclodiphosphate synthase [Bacteroidales bacterium]